MHTGGHCSNWLTKVNILTENVVEAFCNNAGVREEPAKLITGNSIIARHSQ